MMKLTRFFVRKFRSVDESGWIDCNSVSTLIGVNEAGKSNLLLALWKLNPAREGDINLLDDLPRELYSTLRNAQEKPDFIEAEFLLDNQQAAEVSKLTGCNIQGVSVKRNYSGHYKVHFLDVSTITVISTEKIQQVLRSALADIQSLDEKGKGEAGIKQSAISALQSALSSIQTDSLTSQEIGRFCTDLSQITSTLKTSEIQPRVQGCIRSLKEMQKQINRPHPDQSEAAKKFVVDNLPSFVYYSTYGNLDSEIYLPHVIENLKRTDLTGRVAAQTRTLRVLFSFVGLDPQEILEKGKEPTGQLNQHGHVVQPPKPEEIAQAAKNKEERDVLLHSASTRLTKEFRKWWQQGNYVFDLAADGNHFRIWVSDEERPAKVELENRSTGLQWFLSFFLIFLVESEETHSGSILLLDEAGLSLHVFAQKDLINFFEKLAETNQLIHTTHSPFLVNTDHIDRVRVVYVDKEGYTVASSDLRAGEKDPRQSRSVYPVHAAVGLGVSETLLQGCHPVIVEGTSDQFYLSAIKIHLISKGLLTPQREIVFLPSGGVRGVTSVAAILASKDDDLPFIVIDSDKSGVDFKKRLLSNQYQGSENRVVEIKDVLDIEDGEIEDLLPFSLLRPVLSRMFRNVENVEFEDVYSDKKAIVPQIDDFASTHKITLELGWKVEIARQVKARLLQLGPAGISDQVVERWQKLFEKIYPDMLGG